MPGAHQVPADIFPGADQVPGCFLPGTGTATCGDLAQFQQPGQMQGIVPSVFTRSPEGRWSLDGAATGASMPAARRNLARTKPVGPAS